MGIGDLDSGARFGLVPIGLPDANLGTERSDTERRQMPGLATRSSVFAWNSDIPQLTGNAFTAPPMGGTINLRKNTAPLGTSVDVPTWAAGAVIIFDTYVDTMGVGVTYHEFSISTVIDPTNLQFVESSIHNVINQHQQRQVIVPFYDEPLIRYDSLNNLGSALGSEYLYIYLLGFVRNV